MSGLFDASAFYHLKKFWYFHFDYKEMVMARWPNSNFEDGSIWNKEDNWAHGLIDDDETALCIVSIP